MKTTLLHLKDVTAEETQPNNAFCFTEGGSMHLSFRPFLRYLREKVATECLAAKTAFYRQVLERFEQYPELLESDSLQPEQLDRYRELLDLVYATVSSPLEDETGKLWALSFPLEPTIFYGTDAFYELLMDPQTGTLNSYLVKEHQNDPDLLKRKQENICAFVLQKLYNFPSLARFEDVHSFIDPKTGLPRYFRINPDVRFVDIKPVGELPAVNYDALNSPNADGLPTDKLSEVVDLSQYRFEGFAIITLTEVTAQHTTEHIKDIILQRTPKTNAWANYHISQSLKTLAGSSDVEFVLFPLFRVNNKLVLNHENVNAFILSPDNREGLDEESVLALLEGYISNPRGLFIKDTTQIDVAKYFFASVIQAAGIASFGIFPVYHNKELVGLLEVYSKKPDLLDERMLASLEPAMPLLAQLLQNSIQEFNAGIDSVIKRKFTSLQPAVQWKFNEAAWHYLQAKREKKNKEIETIRFKKVYPLYGAIDIRNSTIERNQALLKDLHVRFDILEKTLVGIKTYYNLALIDEMVYKCRKWRSTTSLSLTPNEEIRLNDFFDGEILPFLQHFKATHENAASLVNIYLDAIEEPHGEAFKNRRQLEESMQLINAGIATQLEQMKDELQQIYPCYFEQFRTDGIEYDIYIGQAIAPDKPFNILYLKNLRLLQLSSMASIIRYTRALLPSMSTPLHTTQLIFIHTNTIDINFRNDERRFDVEGAYNTRYQVIKKRIDKVHVQATNERLTQPGKIALVYFNQKDADEYVQYIHYLQKQQILAEDLEFLELEELQGVSGLKALRVGVRAEEPVRKEQPEAQKVEAGS